VTRWADTFAALSRGTDTLDTMRHSEAGAATVSQSVNSVTASPEPPASLPLPPPLDRPLATWSDSAEERAAIVEHDGGIPRAWAEGFARPAARGCAAAEVASRYRCDRDDRLGSGSCRAGLASSGYLRH
jgi:hypothetical protein